MKTLFILTCCYLCTGQPKCKTEYLVDRESVQIAVELAKLDSAINIQLDSLQIQKSN